MSGMKLLRCSKSYNIIFVVTIIFDDCLLTIRKVTVLSFFQIEYFELVILNKINNSFLNIFYYYFITNIDHYINSYVL